ncbi:MAG: hypothetical protein CSA40_01095, partial [Flavobacteriales bacterium]
MALQTITDLFIGDLPVTVFKSILLNQQIGAHHVLQIVCRMDVLEDMSLALGEQSKNFLGETLTMEIQSLEGFGTYKPLQFMGVVTQIKTIKGHEASNGDEIVITAQSPSFLADDGYHYKSHNEVSLSDIIGKTFESYDTSKLSLDIRPKDDITIDYSVQHHESSYAYARRLASQYGEWFYYDGVKLVFGEPDSEEISLIYGVDLKEYQLSLIPQSQKYKIFTNDYLTNQVQEKSTSDVSVGLNGFNAFVSDKSDEIFTQETQFFHATFNDAQVQNRLDKLVEKQRKAIAVNQVKITGTSDNPGVKLGSLVKVEGVNYRVVKVTHTNNDIGDYENHFEGVTSEDSTYPLTDINSFPKSETQTAIIKENTDPEGLGRVRVQFHWQKMLGEMTPWIRIVTPHAGGDKGFHFIPEVGEEVLVGFEGGNAEHPYVMGSLYNGTGKAGAFKGGANDIKALQTRSGNKLVMNDNDGSVTITDHGTASMMMDGSGNTSVSTNAKHTTSVGKNACKLEMDSDGNVSLDANEKLKITIGSSTVELLKDGTIKVNGKTITIMGDDIGIG